PATTGSLDVTQRFPVGVEQLAVIVRKVGDTKVTSPQIARQQQLTTRGETYIAATGPGIAAGQPISLSLADLPHHSPVPRWTALSAAGVIVLAGVWASTRKEDGTAQEATRKRLLARREKLFADLVKVERDRRSGRGDVERLA